jgi:hypothetical protein
LHTFLITAPWFPITTRGEESFAKVSDAWLLTDRRTTRNSLHEHQRTSPITLALMAKPFEILSEISFGLKVWNYDAIRSVDREMRSR